MKKADKCQFKDDTTADLFNSIQHEKFDPPYVKHQKRNIAHYLGHIIFFFLFGVCVVHTCAFYLFPPNFAQLGKIKSEIKDIKETIKYLSYCIDNIQNIKTIENLDQANVIKRIKRFAADPTQVENKGQENVIEISNKVEAMKQTIKRLADNITEVQNNVKNSFLDLAFKLGGKINTIEKSIQSITVNESQIEDKLTKKVTEVSSKMQDMIIEFSDELEKKQNLTTIKLNAVIDVVKRKTGPGSIDLSTVDTFLKRYCHEYLVATSISPVGHICLDIIGNRS